MRFPRRLELYLISLSLASLLCSSAWAARFTYDEGLNSKITEALDIPLFYAFPPSAYAPLPDEIDTTDTLAEYRHPSGGVGFRLYITKKSGAGKRLAASGFVQTGDVILSFRPEWGFTGPYSNIQMGISHAGVAYVTEDAHGKTLKNIDNPLNSEYLGQLDSKHYKEATVLHIFRPRGLTDNQKNNIRDWATRLVSLASKLYPAQISFNQDYTAPKFKPGAPLEFVKKLGRMALGLPTQDTGSLAMYCSEFAWALLALRDCPLQQIDAFTTASVPSCIQPPFTPLAMAGNAIDQPGTKSEAGLSDGPLLIIEALAKAGVISGAEKEELLKSVFAATQPLTKMSAGHRQVAETMAPFFGKLLGYYMGIGTQTPEALQLRKAFNAKMPPNYSPTSYAVNSLLPHDNENRVMDYVGTIYFTGE